MFEKKHVLLLSVLLLAAVVRGLGVTAESLWTDELYGLWRVAGPIDSVVDQPADPHPPLYYLLLAGWTRVVGTSEVALRWPSVLAGVTTVAALYAIARRIWPADSSRAWTAAGLLALSPMHVWYSQEARMYAPACMLATLAGLAAVLVLQQGRARYVVAYVGLALAALYTDYSALAPFAAGSGLLMLGLIVGGAGRKRVPALLLANLLVILGCVPWWPRFQVHLDMLFNPEMLAIRLRPVLGAVGIAVTAEQVLLIGACAALPVAALTGAWLYRRWRAARGGAVDGEDGSAVFFRPPLARVFWIGICMAFVAWMLAGRGLTVLRQTTASVPWLLLGTAAATASMQWQRRHRLWPAGACLLISFAAVAYMGATVQKEPWRECTSLVAAMEESGDSIYVMPDWARIGFDYYYHGSAAKRSLPYGEIPETVFTQMSQFPRIWVVLYNGDLIDPAGRTSNWLDSHFRRAATYRFGLIEMRLYTQ